MSIGLSRVTFNPKITCDDDGQPCSILALHDRPSDIMCVNARSSAKLIDNSQGAINNKALAVQIECITDQRAEGDRDGESVAMPSHMT